MAKSTASIEFDQSFQALTLAEALSAQIDHQREMLDHRTLFSSAFNRKLSRKIEVLVQVRERCLEVASVLHDAEMEEVKNAQVT